MPRRVPSNLALFVAILLSSPALAVEGKSTAATTASAADKDPASSEAAAGDINVSWKGGQLVFPDTGGKPSDLRVRCTGSVTVEGNGITAKTADLNLTIEKKAAAPKALNLSLRCTGDVTIQWRGFTARAANLQYNAEKNLWTLSSGGRPNGCTFRSKNSDGTCSLLIAEQISISPLGNKVDCVGVKEYKAAAGPADDVYPSVPAGVPMLAPTTYAPPPYPAPAQVPTVPGAAR